MLSKSRYVLGLNCIKALYLELKHPELKAPLSLDLQRRFETGNQVGAEARKRYPQGVMVPTLEATQKAIADGTPVLFEATFAYDKVLVQVDILRKNPDGSWDILEVKGTSSVKDEHFPDMAIQRFVLEKAGLKIHKSFLVHINGRCFWPDPQNLFLEKDCTEGVLEEMKYVPENLEWITSTLASEKEPDIKIHGGCYDCGFKAHCWKNVPEYSVFELQGVYSQDRFQLYHEGIQKISDIPADREVPRMKKAQVEALLTRKPVILKKELKNFLNSFEYPIYFLDFETLNPTIPVHPGTNPFEQTPFQASLHVMRSLEGPVEHYEFLADSKADPRPGVARFLEKHIGPQGTIAAYNAKFERSIIKKLSETFPYLSPQIDRFKDLMDCFTQYYFHPEFHAKYGLKTVLPVLVPGMTYEGMEVASGLPAQIAFEKMIADTTSADEKAKLRKALLAYCEKDTLAMVELFKTLIALT